MSISQLLNSAPPVIRTEPRQFYRPHELDKRGSAKKAAPEEASDAAKEKVSLEFTDEVAIKAHLTMYQAGKSIAACAKWCGVSYPTLMKRWKELGAPTSRTVDDRAWAGPSTEATAEEETPSPAPDPQPQPQPEPEATPTATAVAATRPVEEVSAEVAELPAMFQLLQSLMASGADVRGSVRVKFDVEIDFPIGGE